MFVLLRLVSEIRIGMGFMLNIVASCLKRMHKYKVSNNFLIAMSVWLCFIFFFIVKMFCLWLWKVRIQAKIVVKHNSHDVFSSYAKIQGVLALCEFHYCEFRYCGFSKPLLKICLMRFLCTINFVNAVIFLMRFLANATFFQVPKVA